MSFLAGRARIVVKVGSSLLVDAVGELRDEWLATLAEDISALVRGGTQVVIVSSGAVALGRASIGLPRGLSLPQKQASAAVGQTMLTQGYARALCAYDLVSAQALLTLDDTEDRAGWLNARATLDTLLGMGVIPVVNENDTVATDEIRYGDNDRLAARVAQMIGADALVLLSDIDGLHTADPRAHDGAEHIAEVSELTPDILDMGGGAGTAHGTGGMATKLMAARIAMGAGCDMAIHDGRAGHPLRRLETDRITWFRAKGSPLSARRQWIAGSLRPRGEVHVDAGAARAVAADKSLLVAGVTAVDGEFQRGDAVDIVCDTPIARGLAAYGAEEARRIRGKRSSDIDAVLGYSHGPALVHRDNLVRL